MIFPEAIILILSRSPNPTRQSSTKANASRNGKPMLFEYSNGAAPVPPSPPSTVIKSGVIPDCFMALHTAINSLFRPMASLKPTGLPPLSSRSVFTNSSNPTGVENALCVGGDITSVATCTSRISAISGVFLCAGKIPP